MNMGRTAYPLAPYSLFFLCGQIVNFFWLRCILLRPGDKVSARCFQCASSTSRMSRLNTLRELAHNPSGASPQPLGSRLPRGCGLAGFFGCVLSTILICFVDNIDMFCQQY